MLLDAFDKNFSIFGQFFLANPTDLAECPQCGGLLPGHIAQGPVAKHDVGRHSSLAGQFTTQITEYFEKLLVDVFPVVESATFLGARLASAFLRGLGLV